MKMALYLAAGLLFSQAVVMWVLVDATAGLWLRVFLWTAGLASFFLAGVLVWIAEKVQG